MKKNLSIFLLLCSLIACVPSKQREQGKNSIVFSEATSSLNPSCLLVDKRYVSLETKEECLLSEITQLECTSDELFIFDLYTQSVYVFDHTGKFLRKLHKTGQGPGEYAMITSISIDETNNRISVIDLGQKILTYTLDSFTFVDEIQIETTAAEMIDKDHFICYNSLPTTVKDHTYPYHLLKCDREGQIEQQFLPIEFESGYTMRPIYRFYHSEGSLFMYPPFTSNIYRITSDSCILQYDIEYENLSFPPLDYLESIEKQGDNYIKHLFTDHFVYFVQIFENRRFLTSQFLVGEQKYIGIYDKEQKKGFYYPKAGHDFDYLQIVGTHKESFISTCKTDSDSDMQFADDQLKQILSDYPEGSNPLLLFFHISDKWN